jgi:Zn-dependent protease with chaperone function
MYFLLGLSIVLAALLVFNSCASLLGALLWKCFRPLTRDWLAASRVRILFLLRTFPAVAGITTVVLLLARAYLAHEPRANHESISLNLALLAFVSALGIGLALARGIATGSATARLKADWMLHAQPIELPGVSIPTYLIEHKFPVIAIVGVLRPRLFIASQVFQALASGELAAAIEHESGHVLAQDNLKRGLMRACRDALFIIPCGRSLDGAWAEASETAADEHAARAGASAALDLASALVKIARLIPPGLRPAMPAGAFLVGTDEIGGIKSRVRRLVQLANDTRDLQRVAIIGRIPIWIPLALTVFIVAITANEPYVLSSVHAFIEHAVYFLD